MGAALDLFRVIWEPGAVFARVSEKARFWQPFLLVVLLAMVLAFFQLPYTKAAMMAQFAQNPAMTPEMQQRAMSFAPIGLVFVPIIFAIILLLNALLLWVTVSVVGGEGKFSTLLSVTTYASISFVMLSAIGVVVMMTKGTGAITSMEDLQPALGLDLLAPGAKGFMLALLRGINPFAIFGVFLTATGVAVTHKLSKGSAYTAALVQFFVVLLVSAGLAGLRR
jgi:hypothetical protein